MASTEVAVAIASVPGIVALAGCVFSYGQAMARLKNVEIELAKVSTLEKKVAAIDERTRGTDANVSDIKRSVDRIVDHLLENGRALGPARSARSG